jgi:hypothetical protein
LSVGTGTFQFGWHLQSYLCLQKLLKVENNKVVFGDVLIEKGYDAEIAKGIS